MKKYFLSFLTVLTSTISTYSQIDGDNIFGSDQVITIELTFSQTDFWDSLETNYTTETYMNADLTLTDSTGSYTFSDIGIRLKGNSTYGYPGTKKSFKIDFNKYVSTQNYDGLKKLNFNNAYKDPTMMREKIFFDLCQDVGVPAPRANFANVYMNGTHWGFYTVVEQIDDQFLDWKILDDDGNLFKAGDNFGTTGAAADLQYYGTDQTSYEDRYSLKTNEDVNDWTDLIELIDFIDNSSNADFENNVNAYIELEDYLTSVALDNLFSSLDSYLNSARNYYLYHNSTTGLWEWIKWDANETFGSYTGGPGTSDMTQLAINYYASGRPLLEQVFTNATLYHRYQQIMCDLTETYFNPTVMDPRIDAIKALIQDDVYADATKMYTDAQFDTNVETNITTTGGGPGGSSTSYGLKSFIDSRYAYVQSQIDCSTVSVEESTKLAFSIFPNPSNGVITLDTEINAYNQILIHNPLGELVYHQNLISKTIDLSSLPKGMYLITISSYAGKSCKKLILE